MKLKRALLLVVVVGCSKDVEEYRNRSKRTEAELQLHKLSKNVKSYAIGAAQLSFPILTLGPTPTEPCCKHDQALCLPDPAQWTAWAPLEFELSDPFRFQYTYSSTDGKTFTATAIGDLDCDEKTVVYTLTGKIEGDANISTEIIRPTTTD